MSNYFNMGARSGYNVPNYSGAYQYPTQPQYPNMGQMGGYMQATPQPQATPITNRILVTSLDDALGRFADPNSVMFYRHQDKPIEYEIATDMSGRKTYKVWMMNEENATPKEEVKAVDMNDYVLKSDFDKLEERIRKLEEKRTKKVEVENNEH